MGTYLLLVVLLQLPSVQSFIGSKVGSALSEKLGTKVSVGKIDLGFLNRLIIDDVVIYDQSKIRMIYASRVSAKIDLMSLGKDKIIISSAQVFGLNGKFYKRNAVSDANYQFILDSLKSKDNKSKSNLDLNINSLIVRNSSFSYDRYDLPITHNKLNPNHLSVSGLSGHVMINALTNDSLNLNIKKISFNEASGMNINSVSFRLIANKMEAYLSDFKLTMPGTDIDLGNITASYKIKDGKIIPATIEMNGKINNSKITLCDFAFLIPSLKSQSKSLSINCSFYLTSTSLRIGKLNISSLDNSINLIASGSANFYTSSPQWVVNIKRFSISSNGLKMINDNLKANRINIPKPVLNVGNIAYSGEMGGKGVDFSARGKIKTDIGSCSLTFGISNKRLFSGYIQTSGLNLQRLLDNKHFGQIATDIKVKGLINKYKSILVNANGIISRFDYNSYSYKNISINGTYDKNSFDGLFKMDDTNGSIDFKGNVKMPGSHGFSAHLIADVSHFNPRTLKLTDICKDNAFGFKLKADINGSSLNAINGNIDVQNFTMKSGKNEYTLNNLHVKASHIDHIQTIDLNSDVCNASISGYYDYTTLSRSIKCILHKQLPSIFEKVSSDNLNNSFTFNATIEKSDWISHFFGTNMSFDSPVHINGIVNDRLQNLRLDCNMPDFIYNGSKYKNGKILISALQDTLKSDVNVNKIMDNGHVFDWRLTSAISADELNTKITFDNHLQRSLKGSILSGIHFFKTHNNGHGFMVNIKPSQILVGDTVWYVRPSNVIYKDNQLKINEFLLENDRQHIFVSGLATQDKNDSIIADLKNVDANYLLNFVNFHSVNFSGLASGNINVKSVFKNPIAHANLSVKDFTFQDGKMGTLHAKADWNHRDNKINIDAFTGDNDSINTLINGYVSPSPGYIDLNILAKGTRLDFLNNLCGSFLSDVNALGYGNIRVFGPLKTVNLSGDVHANGSLHVKSLNTTYSFNNIPIVMRPDNIIFNKDTVKDFKGHIGVVTGTVFHKHLGHFSFDVNVLAKNLLAYDIKNSDGGSFFGTVYGTGSCNINGGNGNVDIDVNAKAERNSIITYNVDSPDALNKQEFITWNDVTLGLTSTTHNNTEDDNDADNDDNIPQIPTNIHLNFMINCTPEATLKVIMDKNSGDYIALNGSGMIRASYFNKGGFNMFGNYVVDHGIYKLTIQNIIKKDFQFQQGGTILFNGDPYNAALDLKAQYTVNGVSLSDLNIGNSFSSNNVRVNCLMNITGTPNSPKVDFDLNLPTINNDAQQMVKSLINSEEDMNQQVLYLLSIGRFYSQNNNNAGQENAQQSQTSLAMQSLLSGTLSSQLNNVLSSILNNNNWNFGANISTGDEGWNNAEYEGLLSGRLLNNRLLINGQFGYRDNALYSTSFIGDFDIRYLLYPNGNLAVKVYNQTNDRYFTKNSLNTQGIGLIMKKDFNGLRDLFGLKRKKAKQ